METPHTNNENNTPRPNQSANIAGAFIVLFGFALLFKNLNWGIIPSWLFGWEMILIVIGLVIGVNSKFEKKSSYILIGIGAGFLLKHMIGADFGRIFIPAAAIILGVYLIKRNRKLPPTPPSPTRPDDEYDWDKRVDTVTYPSYTTSDESDKTSQPVDQHHTTGSARYKKYSTQYENYLKVDTFFSDTKKIMLTHNFLGGTITSVFGSTHINFLQADIKRPVVLDTFQLFGSTKIIIPPHWQVSTNVASIFGELDDRRPLFEITTDTDKKIYITGTSIFGGLTIKNS